MGVPPSSVPKGNTPTFDLGRSVHSEERIITYLLHSLTTSGYSNQGETPRPFWIPIRVEPPYRPSLFTEDYDTMKSRRNVQR